MFEEYYAVDGINKGVSPDPFYRAVDDITYTPFDFDAEREKIDLEKETESNYYLSRCLTLTRRSEYHYARIFLSGIIRAEFAALSEQSKSQSSKSQLAFGEVVSASCAAFF